MPLCDILLPYNQYWILRAIENQKPFFAKTNALDFCFSVAVNWPIGTAKSNAIVKVVFLLVNDRVPVSLFIFLHTVQANRE
jgi:hypothetical protein